MKCKAIHKKLIFFLENELPEKEMEDIRLHLAGCHECAAFADYMKNSLNVIGQERNPDINPFFYTRVKARLENQAVKESPTPLLARILQPAVFTLLLLAGVYAGIKIGQPVNDIQEHYYAEQEIFTYLNEMSAEPLETFLME